MEVYVSTFHPMFTEHTDVGTRGTHALCHPHHTQPEAESRSLPSGNSWPLHLSWVPKICHSTTAKWEPPHLSLAESNMGREGVAYGKNVKHTHIIYTYNIYIIYIYIIIYIIYIYIYYIPFFVANFPGGHQNKQVENISKSQQFYMLFVDGAPCPRQSLNVIPSKNDPIALRWTVWICWGVVPTLQKVGVITSWCHHPWMEINQPIS